LAADVVYNVDVTKAFFEVIGYLLNNNGSKSLEIVIAMEKRLWTGDEGEVCAPSFDFFKDCLANLQNKCHGFCDIREVLIDFPIYFGQYYERVDELYMWKITSR
jgi:hypothetical protein